MLDSMIKDKIKENINMAVPLYLMMSYAYYKQDYPIVEWIGGYEIVNPIVTNENQAHVKILH